MTLLKDLKLEDITYQKTLLVIIKSSSMEKTFMTKQLISDMKKLENPQQGKVKIIQDEDYDYIKHHYRLIAVHLSRQKN